MTIAPRMPPAAAVHWDDQGVLRAQSYDDVYFSREGGLEETRAVFLAGCGLPERWQGRRAFTIAELGFGTGLNALATWESWRANRPPGVVLHYLSVEGHPLDREHAARALGGFPEVAALAAELLRRWPFRTYGPQRLWLQDGFCLTVLIGESAPVLASLDAAIDAWFLDGFAPARNPAMWDAGVMAEIARLSAPDATLATYSVAGAVRRGLESAGFEVSRAPGFGAKRERLVARRAGVAREPLESPGRVAIVGGGIAAACLAQALARRGVAATIVCAGPHLADGASGNPAGLVMPRLDRDPGAAATLFRQAFLAAIDLYATQTPQAFAPCGAVQRPDSARAATAFADLLAQPPWDETLLQAAGDGHTLLHTQAGMLDPVAAIATLSAKAKVVLNAPVVGLSQRTGGGWTLMGGDGQVIAEAQNVVLAAGAGLAKFAQTAWLPMPLSTGQVEWARGPTPKAAMVQGAYCGPWAGQGVIFGASFEPTDQVVACESEPARIANLARLRALDAALADVIDTAALRSRASVRATTPDRLPVLGLAPHAAVWDTVVQSAGPRWPGLYIFGGLGARGLTLSPLLAEAMACAITGEPSPLTAVAEATLDPARFLVRARKRGETFPS